jgi:nicotinate-nucleotide adenylyltransferase
MLNEYKKRIGLMGGTFDPIHEGHIFVAQQALKQANLDQIIFIPCRKSPHKIDQQNTSTDHRLAMVKLATKNLAWAQVNDFEITSPIPSYSYLTAEYFQKINPNADLFWISGNDQWSVLLTWKNPHQLAKFVTFLVFDREGKPKAIEGFKMQHLTGTYPASSTNLRRNITKEKYHQWLNPDVCNYINLHNLYRSNFELTKEL